MSRSQEEVTLTRTAADVSRGETTRAPRFKIFAAPVGRICNLGWMEESWGELARSRKHLHSSSSFPVDLTVEAACPDCCKSPLRSRV